MQLLLFGHLRDEAEHLHGTTIPLAGGTVRDVVGWASGESGELALALQRPGVRFAVDQCFCGITTEVAPDSEVAFMSPLSGG